MCVLSGCISSLPVSSLFISNVALTDVYSKAVFAIISPVFVGFSVHVLKAVY